jgi:hypothetical protein
MGSPEESLKQKNVFTEKYDEIRRLDGTRNHFAAKNDFMLFL